MAMSLTLLMEWYGFMHLKLGHATWVYTRNHSGMCSNVKQPYASSPLIYY